MKKFKFKERKKLITFPVFLNYKVHVIVSNNPDRSLQKLENAHKMIVSNGKDFRAMHICLKEKQTSYLLLPDDATAGEIAHECWHATRYIVNDWAGGGLDNEVVAYHLGYLVQEVYKFVNS
jgi:hypothetical protein